MMPTHFPLRTRSARPNLLLLLFILALPLIACGGGGGDAASGDGDAAPAKRFLSLGTAPTGGAFFVVGGALAEVADQSGPEGWTVTAEATAGSQENIRRLASGELDGALSNAAISYFAARGEASWQEVQDIRAVMTLAPNIALFVTKADSGIETIADLKGKRVVVGPPGAGFEMFVGPLLEAHGVTYDDFEPLNATQTGAVDLLADGSAAAAFLGGAIPTGSIVQASSSMDIRLIPFDEDAKAQLLADYPFFSPATIPAGTYRGQDTDYAGLNVGSMHLITAANADEDMVYQLTKTIYENRDAVVERHPAGKAINPKNAARFTGLDFHAGAQRFYEEIGIWPQAETDAPADGDAEVTEGAADDGGEA